MRKKRAYKGYLLRPMRDGKVAVDLPNGGPTISLDESETEAERSVDKDIKKRGGRR